jgi:hypothetical protein
MIQLKRYNLTILILLALIQACSPPELSISIKNGLDFDRSEVLSITTKQLKKIGIEDLNAVEIIDSNGKPIITQVTAGSKLLFQAIVAGNSEVNYTARVIKGGDKPSTNISTYSRIVPERLDDYAWENDKVAFRTYGPEGQRQAAAGVNGATTSSGMDCWLKRVDYPILNKWYKKQANGGSYHKDDGEGLDNYHVGASRGCGGIGIFANDTLYTSKNFQKWNTIDEGPLQTNFTLTYDPWEANGSMISEEKKISLDLGSNMMKVEVTLKSAESINQATAGIAIHDSLAVTNSDKKTGWFNVWSPHADSELGTALVVNPSDIKDYVDFRTSEKDKSHLFVHANTTAGKLTYYAGFTWMKSGQFKGQKDWESYLDKFAKGLKSPLSMTIN